MRTLPKSMGRMPNRPAAVLTALLLSACAATPEADDPERLAGNARQRIKLEDLAYCTAEAQDRAEVPAEDPAFRAAVDRCMVGLGYVRVAEQPGAAYMALPAGAARESR